MEVALLILNTGTQTTALRVRGQCHLSPAWRISLCAAIESVTALQAVDAHVVANLLFREFAMPQSPGRRTNALQTAIAE